MKLSLVIPCYNEENNVRQFFQTANHVFAAAAFDVEYVFVDDGSADETFSQLKKVFEENPQTVKVVTFSRNFGKESAIYAGLQEAEGDLITLIDADLQQNPSYVPSMVAFLDAHPDYDCVAMYQSNRHEGLILKLFKNCFYKLINSMSDVRFMQGASDFRTFRREVAEVILKMTEYHRFSKGIFSWVGFRTEYMPYEAEERFSGKSKWSFHKLFGYAMDGIIAFSVAPLKIANWLGCFASAGAFIYAIVVLIQKLAFGINVSGYATIVILILLLGGLQLLTLGIIGQYLARTYLEVKNRPIYIAKKVLKK